MRSEEAVSWLMADEPFFENDRPSVEMRIRLYEAKTERLNALSRALEVIDPISDPEGFVLARKKLKEILGEV
jgi:hypothetical protein